MSIFKSKAEKELDEIIQRLEMNMANALVQLVGGKDAKRESE